MLKLSEREWLVLGVLWDSGGAALGELTQALHEETGWNRNTVLTYLTRMEAKGLVVIEKAGYPRRYRAALSREDCRAQARGPGGGVFEGEAHLPGGAGGAAAAAGRNGSMSDEPS